MQTVPTYVIVKKARGPKGIYREVMTPALNFEDAQSECTGMNISQMTDAVIEYYTAPFNGAGLGEDYYSSKPQPLTDNSPMPWGKYKDKAMSDVPAQYLLWLFENGKVTTGPVMWYINSNLDALKQERAKSMGNRKYGDK